MADAAVRGVPRSRLRGSDLRTLHRGARTPAANGDTVSMQTAALSAVLPAYAFFAGTTAAQIHDIPLPPHAKYPKRQIEVGVPIGQAAIRRRGVIGRRLQLRASDVTVHRMRRVTTPARTWCDLAAVLTVPELVAAGDHILRVGLASVEELTAALELCRRHRRKLTVALPLLDARAESPKESELRTIIRLSHLPTPVPQVVITAADGSFIARVDLCFEEYGEVLEYQGDHHRTDQAQWRRDRTREDDIESTGRHVTEVIADDLLDPDALIERIARNLRRRGWTGP